MTCATAGGAGVYSGLARADRVWLRRAAADLRVRLRRSVAEVVRAGRVLAQARRRLGRGLWVPWLAAEAGVPRRTASRLVAVDAVFGKCPADVLARFTPSALYALVEPGTPRGLREYAVEQAGDGAAVTEKVVAEWLAAYRDPCPGGVREASKDPPKPPAAVEAGEVWAADNWARLCGLLAGDATVHLAGCVDAENGDRVVSAVVVAGGARRAAAGADLEAVVLALTGGRREKGCARCRADKPLDQFSLRRDQPDGRNRYCLQCERNRVQAYARRKAAERRAG